MPLSRRARLRRTGLLCLHTLRNLAYHRAIAESRQPWREQQFWIAAHNNYIDVAILEWCKLFTDRAGMHHWRKSVTRPKEFTAELYAALRSDVASFQTYALSVKVYRGTFVAHLDEENDINIPRMSIAKLSTQSLYEWLQHHEDDCNAFHDAPLRADRYYAECFTHARRVLLGEA